MVRILSFYLLVSLLSITSLGQSKDETEILKLLERQSGAWNRGDLDSFIIGYWENDSLMYIGKSGIRYGYANTLDTYKKSYSDTAKMGKLSFETIHMKKLSPEYYFIVGKWFLKRTVGDVGGYYTLLFRKIRGKWVIIADHSS